MSGHSKWAQIKRQKAVTDIRRGKVFSKMSKIITIAARDGGDPNFNPRLRLTILRAEDVNMPKENIERAIKKGTGEIEGASIESITYEAYGPGGVALMIETLTDNKNRTASEIKHLLASNGGRIAEPGSVKWMFSQNGILEIDGRATGGMKKEEIELAAIDAGALDVEESGDGLEIYTKLEDLDRIRKALEAKGLRIVNSVIAWMPQNPLRPEDNKAKEQVRRLFEILDEQDDVQEIYSNIENF